jgi:threonylcarbamoyladenosine tRNA methylthiotransferase MtaB
VFYRQFFKFFGVLVEKMTEEGIWEGHTSNYLKVRFPYPKDVRGQIIPVKLTQYTGEHLSGEVR